MSKNPNWNFDEIVLVTAEVHKNDWKPLDDKDSRVIELSKILNSADFHSLEMRQTNFRNPNGVSRKSTNIASVHPDYKGAPTNGSKEDRFVVDLFLGNPVEMFAKAQRIREAIRDGQSGIATESSDDELEQEFEVVEGRLLWALHRRRERKSGLRQKKIEITKAKNMPISCEVCDFNFEITYGARGLDYIEVHHKLPLHVSGETKTKLDDLALLCSNCHRIIHRGKWISVEELKKLLST
jgi:5-methylcytosine-specific restriction protein A